MLSFPKLVSRRGFCLHAFATMKLRDNPYLSLTFLTGLNLFNYLDRNVLPAVLPNLQKELHLDDGQVGRANTMFMVGYFLTSPFFGYLGDRFPRKWLIAFGILFWSIGTTMTGFAAELAALLVYRVLVGLGEASYATLAPAWLSDLFAPAKRNNALTIFYVAIPVGAALGYVTGAASIHFSGSWRPGFLWAGAPGLLLAVALLFLREPARGEADGPAAGGTAAPVAKPTVADVAKLFRIRDFVLVLLGYTAYTFVLGGFQFWAPTFLFRVHNVAMESASLFFGGTLVVTGLVATLLGGFAATAWQKRFRAGYSTVLALSILLSVPLAAWALVTPSLLEARVCLAAAMFLLFLPTGPINTLIVESVPTALRASAMAASIFVIHLFGDFWSPEIIGRLSLFWNDPAHAGAGLRRAVLLLPGMLAVGAVFWGWLAWRQAHGPGKPELASAVGSPQG